MNININSRLARSRAATAHSAAAFNGVVENKGGAGALLGLGLVGAVWSASGYIGAFMRAPERRSTRSSEGRPFWKLRPLQILFTLVMVFLLAIVRSRSSSPALAHAVGDASASAARP